MGNIVLPTSHELKGLTPVIATVILVLLTLTAVGTFYVWVSGLQSDAQDQVTQPLQQDIVVKDLQCIPGSTPGNADELRIALNNAGEQDITASHVDIYLYSPGDTLHTAVTGRDWSDAGFTTAGNLDIISVPLNQSGGTILTPGQYYDVELEFVNDGITVQAGRCIGRTDATDAPTTTDDYTSISITDNYSKTDWQDSAQPVEITCTDTESGCTQIDYELRHSNDTVLDAGTATGTDPVTETVTVGNDSDEEGALELWYRGTSDDGNTTTNTTIIKIDKTPPFIHLPTNSSWFSSNTTFTVDEGPSGIVTCDHRTNDGSSGWTDWRTRPCGEVTVSIGSDASNHNCSVEGQGQCGVGVRVTNDAGNTETDTTWFNIDYTTPSTTIPAPSESQVQDADFTVTVDDQDDGAYASCEYRVNDGGSGWTSWYTRSCPDGSFDVAVGNTGNCTTEGTDACQVAVRVEDGAGFSAGDVTAYDINMPDTSGPTTAIVGPDTANTYTSDFTVTVNDTAGGSTLATCRYRFNSGTWQTRACPDSLFTTRVGSDCSSGTCTLDVYVEDGNGENATDQTTYTVDTTSSAVTFATGDRVKLRNTAANLTWGRDHTYRVEKLAMYDRTLGIGSTYNLSVHGTADESVQSTIWTHSLNTFSYGSSVLKIASAANSGTTIDFTFTGATELGSGTYTLYRDGAQIQELGNGDVLTWQDDADGTPHNYTIRPEQ